jgi:hypothetical protein
MIEQMTTMILATHPTIGGKEKGRDFGKYSSPRLLYRSKATGGQNDISCSTTDEPTKALNAANRKRQLQDDKDSGGRGDCYNELTCRRCNEDAATDGKDCPRE